MFIEFNLQMKKPKILKRKTKELSTREKLLKERDNKLRILKKKNLNQMKRKMKNSSKGKQKKMVFGSRPARKMKEKIDSEIDQIRRDMKDIKLEQGKDREAMKQHLRKNMFRTNSKFRIIIYFNTTKKTIILVCNLKC